jgi:hypothetical protein
MALFALDRFWNVERETSPRPKSYPANVSGLLAESVCACLLPHLHASLAAYSARDHSAIFSAYGVGCHVLADLLAQDTGVPGWREAGREGLQRLMQRSGLDPLPDEEALKRAAFDAEWLRRRIEGGPAYLEICDILDGAARDLASRKTAERAGIAIRAALARLEALASSVGPAT